MNYRLIYNKNKSKQIEQAIKVLASWIGEPDSASTNTFTLLTMQNNSEEIKKLNLERVTRLKKIDDFIIYTNKENIQNTENEIFILAIGDRGLANGIYYLYMKLKESQTQDPFAITWDIFQTPRFETRGMTLHFALGLEGLSTETWTLSQWKDYLNRLRSFNYTSIVYIIGGGMLYHPDFKELKKNLWRNELAEEIFKYAADIGLEIVLIYVFNQIPTELWIKYPEIRSKVFGYQGISYCSQKGKKFGENLFKYTLNRFNNIPGHALFAFEGGVCNCDYCRHNIVDLIIDYLNFIKENAKPQQLFFCTWFANVKEHFESPPIEGLREKLFSKVPKEVKIIDVNRKTLKMAAEQGYEIYDFVFFIDPEEGMENQLIFPRPHLNLLKERITDSIKALPSLQGMVGYRIIPKTRFINDYALGRYLWNPEIKVNEVVSEVAGLLSSSMNEKEKITDAILLLEDFWRTLDGNKLKECKDILKTVIEQQKEELEPLKSIQEAIEILELLFRYYSVDSIRKKSRIFEKIFQLMRGMDTFQCYTSYQAWNGVSREMIKQRIQWWTNSRNGLFDPKAFPWNCLLKAKYHLIDNKKDALPWMKEMKISQIWL